MNLKKLFFAAVIILSANATFAQDTNEASHLVTINIDEVALLDLESLDGNNIILKGTAPTEAGEAITFGDDATNETIWVNYSSILGNDTSRSVTVSITDGTVPAGLKLTVLAAADAAVGAGTMGAASASAITLYDTAQDIITGIGSAYTGDGSSAGHKLTYQLAYANDAATDYEDLDFDNSDVLTITYTLSDI